MGRRKGEIENVVFTRDTGTYFEIKDVTCFTLEEVWQEAERILNDRCLVIIRRNWDNSFDVDGIYDP